MEKLKSTDCVARIAQILYSSRFCKRLSRLHNDIIWHQNAWFSSSLLRRNGICNNNIFFLRRCPSRRSRVLERERNQRIEEIFRYPGKFFFKFFKFNSHQLLLSSNEVVADVFQSRWLQLAWKWFSSRFFASWRWPS